MPDAIHVWSLARALKFLGLGLLLLGFGGVVVPERRALRLQAAYGLLVPGFVTTFAGGWLLMKLSGRELREPWLIAGAMSGLCAMHMGFIVSHRTRCRRVSPMLAWACTGAALASMTLRVSGPWLLPVCLCGAMLGGAMSRPFWRTTPVTSEADRRIALKSLKWLGRVEGLSLLVMLATMTLRTGVGFRVDGGTGIFGLTHGVLVLAYLQSLSCVGQLEGWPFAKLATGVLSSLLPGGTLWFERRALGPLAPDSGLCGREFNP